MKDQFKLNAELTIKTFKETTGTTLDYDKASVAWLDGYIERQRHHISSEAAQSLISVLGSFLGECIRTQYGGAWLEHEAGWAICFAANNCVFPFNKVQKQLAAGPQESILSFYTTIPILFNLDTAQ